MADGAQRAHQAHSNVFPSRAAFREIYMDLDGVLVNFEAGFRPKFEGLPARKLMWKHINANRGFFEHLPWMPGAQSLWDHAKSFGVPVTVLSGVADGPLGARSAREKRRWVQRELGTTVKVLTCTSKEKSQYSGPGRLIIDDRIVVDWEVHGGKQILHTSVEESIAALTE
eukprot:CAMPEP_0206500850 /NCGR_PEP_ID=MMETSP0324_2-20121206/52892_1 /ASSEMBLY_ACC=CAM_ASM_000836 /TAXON_ID=2866 /ORGANISM="Crypthecodinium cohnii, Strain Seligo" /LENGTH=169 /DNA_ID=CAMNT_0053988421 /DNA_START=49 /DNA_END=555 /DNA_ORIENTATION=-